MATKKTKMGKAVYTEPNDYFPKSVQDMLNGKKKTTKKSTTKKSGTTKKKK